MIIAPPHRRAAPEKTLPAPTSCPPGTSLCLQVCVSSTIVCHTENFVYPNCTAAQQQCNNQCIPITDVCNLTGSTGSAKASTSAAVIIAAIVVPLLIIIGAGVAFFLYFRKRDKDRANARADRELQKRHAAPAAAAVVKNGAAVPAPEYTAIYPVSQTVPAQQEKQEQPPQAAPESVPHVGPSDESVASGMSQPPEDEVPAPPLTQ